jgi:hypothetical protein
MVQRLIRTSTVLAGPVGLSTCGWLFWLFILSGNVCAVIFVWLLCPETAGRTLEQGQYSSLHITIVQYIKLMGDSGLLVHRRRPSWIAKGRC